MTTWQERVAARFVPAAMPFEEFSAQHPTELIDLIDRAKGHPVRSLSEHYANYLVRLADPAEQAALTIALAEAKQRNHENETLLRRTTDTHSDPRQTCS